MAITSPISRVNALGNGSATSFSFSPVTITQATDLEVWLLDASGNQTLLAQGLGATQYVVVMPNGYPGTGTITYPGSGGTILATGWSLIMKQRAPQVQQFQPTNQGAFLAGTYGNAFDYAILTIQALQEQLGRSFLAPETDPSSTLFWPSATARANQFAAFDGSGNPTCALTAGSTPVSISMQPVVDASSTTLALSLLGGSPTMATIAVLRASSLSVAAPMVAVDGYAAAGDGGGGIFVYVSSDSTSADNGGTIIKDSLNRRYYRLGATSFNVKQFGATGNGVTDDTTAITKAIAAAGVVGAGFVDFPAGNYLISSTLTIGNGTSSAASTVSGIVLRGVGGQPGVPGIFAGFSASTAAVLTWGGGAAAMISIAGPLQGWGVQNLILNGTSTATNGLSITSAQFGDCRNLGILGCVSNSIGSNTYALFGSMGSCDSLSNSFENIYISLPNVANVKGIVLTGNTATNSDTDFNVFKNVIIGLAGSAVSTGIYLQNCDSNSFYNILLAGGSAASFGVNFDYTASVNNAWPSSNSFFGIDTNGNTLGANQWVNGGTPGASAGANLVVGLAEGNGATQPNIANMRPDLPVVLPPSVNLTGQSASIGSTNIVLTPIAGIYRISGYLALTTTGNSVTVTVTVGWTDLSGAGRTFTSSAINFSAGTNNPQSFSVPIVAEASTEITYLTTVSGAAGAGRYSLAVVVEKLS